MQTTLLTLNSPNLNGRVYSTEVVQEAIRKYVESGKPMLIQNGFTQRAEVDLELVCGAVENVNIDGDKLLGDVQLFPSMKHLDFLSVRPSFVGKLDKDGVVTEATLLSFNLTSDPA